MKDPISRAWQTVIYNTSLDNSNVNSNLAYQGNLYNYDKQLESKHLPDELL